MLAAVAWAQEGSNFGNTCDVSHHSKQDPIFEPVDGHDHIFFGATSPEVTNADTGDTLRMGHQTSCNREEDNFSAYWLPEVYRNGSTTPLPVDESKNLGDNTIYYRAGDVRNSGIITVFPSDFEIVARDDSGPGNVRWSCDGTGRPLTEAPPTTCSTRLLKFNIQVPQCWNQAVLTDLVTGCIKNVPQGTPEDRKPPECKDPENP